MTEPSAPGEAREGQELAPEAYDAPRLKALSSLLSEAENHSNLFHWKRTAETYTTCLALFSENDLEERGRVLEIISLCRFQASMQSASAKDFARTIRQAIRDQQRARASFQRLGAGATPHVLRSRAMESYFAHWLAMSPAEKRRLLNQSWSYARQSLRLFEASKNYSAFVKTYNTFSFGLALSVEYEENLRRRIRKLKEAIKCGKKALLMAESVGNKRSYTEALVKTSLFLNGLADDQSLERESGQNRREALQLWEKAMRMDRETSLLELSHPLSGFHQIPDPNLNLQLCKEALEIEKPRRDNFAIGRLLDHLAKWTHYAAQSSESGNDPILGPKVRAEALAYAEEAAQRYDIINFSSPIAGVLWVHSPYTEHFQELARCQIDPARRRLLLGKGLRCTGELLRLAERTENKRVMFYAFHTSYKCEAVLATNETNARKRKELLLRALSHSVQAYKLIKEVGPSTSWNRGVAARAVARVLSKLAEMERSPRLQRRLLLDAAARLEEGLEVTTAFVAALQRPGHHTLTAQIGQYYNECADTMKQLAVLTNQEEYFRKAASRYSAAADWYGRIPRYDRIAECYWKLAETYDRLQAYSFASENFVFAARAYSRFGRRIAPLREHSQDYRRYMIAWSKIELARASHAAGQTGKAAQLYDLAAHIHRLTKRWRSLAPYYSGRAQLERGEYLSKRGLRSAAISSFHKAAVLFAESRTRLDQRLPTIDQPDEKKMVEELLKTPSVEYCQTMRILEEAMEAQSQEDYLTSFEKFGLASEKLGEALNLSESEQDRREIVFLSVLCDAWRLSCKAEIGTSTELLTEACARFEEARDISPSQNAMKLALGHVAFCKALISNRNFAQTRELSFLSEASKQLDIASGYYLEAGSKTASVHATARKLLIEAFKHLEAGGKEKNQDEKSGLYRIATAQLRDSIRMFVMARQPKMADHARSFLERAAVESKIASELNNILVASRGSPTNIAFHTQVSSSETPAGLDRFEGGDLEVRLVKVSAGPSLEKDVELEIEITNTGKQPIQLACVDGVVPERTKLIGLSEKWTPKGRSLAGALRRLDTLQMETVRIKLRPEVEGLLMIQPKVTFVDASGMQRERAIEGRILVNSRIMEFLANSFIVDCSRRLAIPSCGWRTLMDVVGTLKIPRSHVYGEPRYGRSFGRQLDALVRSTFVEYRIFLGERGRGGRVTKVRANPENVYVSRYLGEMTAKESHSFTPVGPFLSITRGG